MFAIKTIFTVRRTCQIRTMQKDKNLHQLFRAHLPIAVLPPEFADRLAKAVLNEVAQLHQATPLVIHPEEQQTAESEQLNVPATPQKRSPFNHSTPILILFLLLNLQLWPLLQGCSYNPNGTLSVQIVAVEPGSPSKTLAHDPATGLQAAPAVALAEQLASSNKPSLGPLKPHLPVQHVLPAGPWTLIATATTPPLPAQALDEGLDERLVNQHGPPGTAQPTSITAIIMPHEEPATAQATATDPPATSTASPTSSEPNEPTATLNSATATSVTPTSAPSNEPTSTATMTALPPPPAIHIFEPTLSPTPIIAELPSPTPTLYIRPWQTSLPDATATPAS